MTIRQYRTERLFRVFWSVFPFSMLGGGMVPIALTPLLHVLGRLTLWPISVAAGVFCAMRISGAVRSPLADVVER